jgi:hypothetical protein
VVQVGESCKQIAATYEVSQARLEHFVKTKLYPSSTGAGAGAQERHHYPEIMDKCPRWLQPLDSVWVCPGSEPKYFGLDVLTNVLSIRSFLMYYIQAPYCIMWATTAAVLTIYLDKFLKYGRASLFFFVLLPLVGSIVLWLPMVLPRMLNISKFNIGVLGSILLRNIHFVLKTESLRLGSLSNFFRFSWICIGVSRLSLAAFWFQLSIVRDPRAFAMAEVASTQDTAIMCDFFGILSFDTAACGCLAIFHVVLAAQCFLWSVKTIAQNPVVHTKLSRPAVFIFALKEINLFLIYWISPHLQEYPPKFTEFMCYGESLNLFKQLLLMTIVYQEEKIDLLFAPFKIVFILQGVGVVSLALLFTEKRFIFLLVRRKYSHCSSIRCSHLHIRFLFREPLLSSSSRMQTS